MIQNPSALPQFIQPDSMPTGYILSSRTGLFSIEDNAGTVTNLNTLFAHVIGYTGGGMPPISNLTIPYGQLGGAFYQKTTVQARVFTIVCVCERNNLFQMQQARQALINIIRPNSATQQAEPIYLRYATTNYKGTVIGKVLRVAVNYVGGLEGNTDNLFQEKIALQFIEYQPPSIKELAATTTSLSITQTTVAARWKILTRTEATQLWTATDPASILNPYTCTASNPDGTTYWIGTAARIYKSDLSVSTATNAVVNGVVVGIASAMNPFGSLQPYPIIVGNFSSPQNNVAYYDGAAWQLPTTVTNINGNVNCIAIGLDSFAYIAGSFTTPAGKVALYNNSVGGGNGWTTLTGGAGFSSAPTCVVAGPDGNIYFGGSFTTVDGVACVGLVRYNPGPATYTVLNTTASVNVQALAFGPDGNLYIGGQFTSIGGITAYNIAMYNGTSFSALGSGGLDKTGGSGQIWFLRFDRYGKLHILGDVNQTIGVIGSTAYRVSVSAGAYCTWDGQNFLFAEVDGVAINTSGSNVLAAAVPDRPNSTTLLVSQYNNNSNYSSANTVSYTGTAPAYPTFTFTAGVNLAPLYRIAVTYTDPANKFGFTTKEIYFKNLIAFPNEVITLALGPTGITSFTSTLNRALSQYLMTSSDISGFALYPGTNYIAVQASGGATLSMAYYNTHFSLDASAGV